MKALLRVLTGKSGFTLVCGCLYLLSSFQAKADTVLARRDEPSCLIVVPTKSPLCRLSAERLKGFMKKVCGKAPQICEKSSIGNERKKSVSIVIGTFDSFEGLDSLELSRDLSKIRRDGYILKTIAVEDRSYILALGKIEKGAANAVWRLMREIDINDHSISAASLAILESPFIKDREVKVCDPWVRAGLRVGSMHEKLMVKYCPRNWSTARLQNYMDMLDSFGYNCVQTNDHWLLLSYFAEDTTREQWRDKIVAMADRLHRNGQKATLMVYGSSVKDFNTGKEYTRPGACFNDPHERQILLQEYDYLANAYAPYVDRIVTWWSDWGGAINCRKGCTIETALKQHNIILNKFREKNLAVESAFSLWAIRPGPWSETEPNEIWPGYKGVDSILDSPVFPREVMVASTEWGGFTEIERLLHIAGKGYRPAIWGWRLLDIEHWHGMHVHTGILEKYFRSLPTEVGEILEWHSVDDVSQFLILSNLYVAGQLMWDPQKSGSELLRQYTKGMFGRENKEKVTSVLEAVEGSCCYLCPGLQAPYDLSFILNDAADRLELIRRAKRTIADVRISADFVPAFPLIIEPEDLIKEIAAQLDVIEPYLQFHVAAADLLLMKEKGASEAEISRAFETLPKVSGSNEYLNRNVPGRYFFDLQKLREELGLGKK